METSNSPDITADVTTETASPVESSAPESTESENHIDLAPAKFEAADKPELTLKEKILAQKGAPPKVEAAPVSKDPAAPAVVPADPAAPVAPKYEPNYKFKAFGKEKEIPEAFRAIIKDQDSEKQVREVFTRAEAFDDMKGRYEAASREGQQVLNDFSALDRDVRRVTGFLNKGDLDNFFASVRLSDADLIKHLQTKAQYMADPALAQQYKEQVDQRAQMYQQQEQFQSLQTNYQTQAVQARTMQLDNILSRPDVSNVASNWDSKMGNVGAFRDLVIQEAASYYAIHKQDLHAEQAVNLALQKFGKLIQGQPPQAIVPPVQAQTPAAPEVAAPQAHAAPVVVAAKPAIPTLNGKGTSPVKQVPKSLADLKRLGREAAKAEGQAIY